MKLSVIIPVYNEEKTIGKTIELLREAMPDAEIIVVDDGSTDNTWKEVYKIPNVNTFEGNHILFLTYSENSGKTKGICRGLVNATGDIIVILDADLEYDPKEIPNLIQPILDGKADAVYGSRFLVRGATRVLYYRHYLANKFLTFLMNVATDLNFTDVETGYKAFRGDILRNIDFTSKGFGFEIEVTAKVAKHRIYEVPISYSGRTYEEGKKIKFKDGLMAIWYVIKYAL